MVGVVLLAVVVLSATFRRPAPWEAADELKAAADATRAYRGWIHVDVVSAPVVPPDLQSPTRCPEQVVRGSKLLADLGHRVELDDAEGGGTERW